MIEDFIPINERLKKRKCPECNYRGDLLWQHGSMAYHGNNRVLKWLSKKWLAPNGEHYEYKCHNCGYWWGIDMEGNELEYVFDDAPLWKFWRYM